MPADPSDSTIELTAQLPSPSPYLAGSITTLDLSLAAHCWAVSAQVPSMPLGKVERRMLSAWATCTNSPDSTIRLAVCMSLKAPSQLARKTSHHQYYSNVHGWRESDEGAWLVTSSSFVADDLPKGGRTPQ